MSIRGLIRRVKSLLKESRGDWKTHLATILGGNKLDVVDVGGAVNLQPHWNKMIGNANFVIYEPDSRSYQDLVNTVSRYETPQDFHYINKALSGTGGQRTLYLTNEPTGSSILPINKKSTYVPESSSYFFPIKEETIETVTLRDSLDAESVKTIDAIKLDIQGAELEVLEALDDNRYRSLTMVELEVGEFDMYIGQPSLGDVRAFLQGKGFKLFDLRIARTHMAGGVLEWDINAEVFGCHRQSPSVSGRVVEYDAIFFKEAPEVVASAQGPSEILKAIGLYCVYHFFQDAVWLAKLGSEKGILTKELHDETLKGITNLRALVGDEMANFESYLSKQDYRSWGQYMWVPYPSN